MTTQIQTQVSITKLKEVHEKTHPGVRVERRREVHQDSWEEEQRSGYNEPINEETTMAIAEMTPKELMLQTIQELPEDSSYEEILRELAVARMVERGLADSEAGRTISHEEMRRRIASWAK